MKFKNMLAMNLHLFEGGATTVPGPGRPLLAMEAKRAIPMAQYPDTPAGEDRANSTMWCLGSRMPGRPLPGP